MRKQTPVRQAQSGGFSLFELVVFIISVAIIYAYAANRFAEFPGQAERANFIAVLTQIQSGVNFEMMMAVGTGRIGSAELLEGVNPMDLMLEAPSNYLGVLSSTQAAESSRRSWYFDPATEELVYLINDVGGAYLLIEETAYLADELRFKMVADYSEVDRVTGLPVHIAERGGNEVAAENIKRRLNGVVLRPTTPYQWQSGEADALIESVTTENG